MKPAEEIRAAVDIVRVVGEYVQLRKQGANLVGLCPFHQEKTASFAVHPTRQIFHCFGCGVGGDVFKFVMLIENVTFPEALHHVAQKAGISLPQHQGGPVEDAKSQERAALYRIHEVAAKFYSAQLSGTAEGRAARAYLADRGLDDRTLAHFHLGYAPSQGQGLARALRESGFTADAIEKSGLLIPAREGVSQLDRFRGRVIFPINNESGKVTAFAGRALGEEQPKYLNSPETPIYTKSRILYRLHESGPVIRKLDGAVLVEGYMDCIALVSAGVENAVASCGTSLTESQVRLLGRYTRRVTVNYDPDAAGLAATERSIGLLLEEGFEVKALTLPGDLDPDAFIRKHGAEAYRERLDRAPAYLDYLADSAAAKHGLGTPEGKIRAVNTVLPYLVKVSNLLLRQEIASRLAERLQVNERLLREEMKRAAQSGHSEMPRQSREEMLRLTGAEQEIIRALVDDAGLMAEFLPRLIEEGVCDGLAGESIFRKLMAEYQEANCLEISRIESLLAPEELRVFFQLQFAAGPPPDRERFLACYEALRRRRIDRERTQLQIEIERADRDQDKEKLSRLLEAKTSLMRTLAGAQRQ
ncbi:MAG: DNA primase [Terriglobia bacterium]